MAKLNIPLLALKASGTIAKAITFQRSRRQNIARSKPELPPSNTPAQQSWRHMYQKAIALWHGLSASEKLDWETLARPLHMTGYAYFISLALKPNPGLYLPLQGGNMTGNITLNPLLTVDGVDLSAHALDLEAHIKDSAETFRTGEYHIFTPQTRIGSKTLSANYLYATPFIVNRPRTINSIGIHVLTGDPAKFARLGIYNTGVNLYPGSLLLDAGVVSVAVVNHVSIIISEALPKGIYFSAVASQGVPAIQGAGPTSWPILGVQDSQVGEQQTGWKVAFAYAALPDPFPAAATLENVSNRSIYVDFNLLSED